MQQVDERAQTLLGGLDRLAELVTQCCGDIARRSPAVHVAPAETADGVQAKTARCEGVDQPVDGCSKASGCRFGSDDDDEFVVLVSFRARDRREIEKVHDSADTLP